MTSSLPLGRVGDTAIVFLGLWQVWAMGVIQASGSLPTLTTGLAVILPIAVGLPLLVARSEAPPGRRLLLTVALLALVAGAGTLSLVRADGDDAFYVGQITGTLAHPQLPVASFDVLHGDVTAPIQQPAHRGQSYELLVAAAAWILPVDHRALYYFVFPVLSAALAMVATALLARDLLDDDDGAALAVGFALGLAFIWAGTHVTPGNYHLVRLFQGKGVFVSTWMPLVLWAALRFGSSPGRWTWTRLVLAVFGASALTSTALVVAPVGAALGVLPFLRPTRSGARLALAGLATAIPSLLVLLRVKAEIDAAAIVPHGVTTWSLWQWLGAGPRAVVAMLLFLALPAVAGPAKRRWAAVYVGVVVVALFNGLSGSLLARVSDVLSWRLYWAVPLLPLVAIALGGLALRGRRQALVVLVALGGFTPGPWVGSRTNRAEVAWPPRYDQQAGPCALAERVITHDVTHPALLERTVAMCTTAWVERPPLLTVRQFYTRHLERHQGPAETRRRLELFRLTLGQVPKARAGRLFDDLDDRCVTALAVRSNARRRYLTLLTEHRWTLDTEQGDVSLYLRDGCPE